jgi:micrococcal nuclease
MWRHVIQELVLTTLLVLAIALPAHAAGHAAYAARVTSVVDGDTVWVRRPGNAAGIEIRLQGIDAPEICQRWGPQARDALRQLLLTRRVTVTEVGHDTYGRTLARLRVGGQDAGGWLVANGHAWSSRFRGQAGPYTQLETDARNARRGLWSHRQPVEPRAFRRQHGSCPH